MKGGAKFDLPTILAVFGIIYAGYNAYSYNKSKYYWYARGYYIGSFAGKLTKMTLSTFAPEALIRPTKPWERYWDLAQEEDTPDEKVTEDNRAVDSKVTEDNQAVASKATENNRRVLFIVDDDTII